MRPVILVLTTSFQVVNRIQRLLSGAYNVVPVSTVDQAHSAINTCELAALFLESRDTHGRQTAALVQPARRKCATLPVAALVRRSDGWESSVLELLSAGPTEVILVEDLDIGSVLSSLIQAIQRNVLLDTVWPQLERDIPSGLRILVREVLVRSENAVTVPEIAVGLGLHRKTLWSWCRRHNIESLHALVMWCRLVAVGHALRTRNDTVEGIAFSLGFASPTAMRNAIRRYLKLTATELRAVGGEKFVCETFARWLNQSSQQPAAESLH